ncbi:AlpA family transcriptional regulator [Neorhizobium sp. T25_13]|uniref:helix-turn-helix transcriptional regulator n=1 Tax=Neorhizobium sp. T25_13 TaxID=2093830 RepID=UPI000CF8A7DC|nr:helix-turn-helix domain-containing protein [Neorhizobium sp. T25_13]
MPKPNNRKLSTADVCQRYGISRHTLRRWSQHPEIAFPKPIWINRIHFFDEAEILKWELRRAGLNPDVPESIEGFPVVSGFITDYDQFVNAMIAQRARRKMTMIELDARSGMQEGYTSKLENYQRHYGRGVGPDTLPLWLGGLRVALVLVELPRATRNFKQLAEVA